MLLIRPAVVHDLQSILDIYNDAVLNTNATFDTEPKTFPEMEKWFAAHGKNHPVIIAELDKKVIGWSSLSKWSDKKAYDTTAEVSVYVNKDFRRQGIGKRLVEIITLEGEKLTFRCLLARISQGNELSIHLFEFFGYTNFGTMKSAGKKFGKFWDVHFLQKIFPE